MSQVERAMEEFDTDGSGVMEFGEFAVMVCTSKEFRFKASEVNRLRALHDMGLATASDYLVGS